MFGRKKTSELKPLLETIREQVSFIAQSVNTQNGLQQKLNELSQKIDEQNENNREMQFSAAQEFDQMRKAISRQSDSFEDLLDTISERTQELDALSEQLKNAQKKERALLQLSICCREQLGLIRNQIQDNQAWADQFRMMDADAAKYLHAAHLQEIGMPGETVDFDLHEVIKVIDTQEERLSGCVAVVYRRGMIYNGEVLMKAQVAAYKGRGIASE